MRLIPLARLLDFAEYKEFVFHDSSGEFQETSQSLHSLARGEGELDYYLTISSEIAIQLGLDALWYQARKERDFPGVVVLQAVDPGELLHLLASELQYSSLVFCDPTGRIAAHNGAADDLLRYLANGPLLGRPLEALLEPLLERGELLGREPSSKREVLIPIDPNASLAQDVSSQPFRGGWLVRFQSKPYLSSSVDANWQSLVNHFPGVVVRLDRHGRVQFSSRKMGSLTAEEVQGKDIFELVRTDSHMTLAQFRDQVMRDRQTLSGEVPVHDPRTRETIWYAFQAVPILVGDDVQAVIYAVDITQRVRAEKDLLASQKHIRALSNRIDQAQEEERRRISRELHDELGGTLTALRLEIGALEKVENLPTLAKEKLEAVEGILSITLSTVRRLASQLRPQILDDLGLTAALLALVNDAARRAGFEHDFHVPHEVPGNKDLHLHLYRICQEALTNICRHSRATKVLLGITRPFRDRLELRIEDDGRGYDPSTTAEKASMGLLGMSERVSLLHGRMEIDASPGRGCRLKVEIPLETE